MFGSVLPEVRGRREDLLAFPVVANDHAWSLSLVFNNMHLKLHFSIEDLTAERTLIDR